MAEVLRRNYAARSFQKFEWGREGNGGVRPKWEIREENS